MEKSLKIRLMSSLIFGLALLLISSVYAQGVTVTSISTSDIITKSTEPSKVYWIINTQLNGGGQSISGIVDPSTVKNLMGGKVYTKQPLSINVESVEEQVFYEIVNEGIPIYKYKLQTFLAPENFLDITTNNPEPCSSDTNFEIKLGSSHFGGYAYKRYCVTKEQVGVKGAYNNPFVSFNAKIRLLVGSDSKEKTICSGAVSGCDGNSISLGDVGTATWSGSLVTGESPPNQNNFVSIKESSSNRWKIVRLSAYDKYSNAGDIADSQLNGAASNFIRYSESQIPNGDAEIANILTAVNSASDQVLSEQASFTSSPFSTDDNTGKVTVTLKRSLTSPNIVFRLKASWLGIVIPSGEPVIMSVSTNKLVSGESGRVEVQIKNIGESEGTFSAMLVNCEPFIQSTSTQTTRRNIQPDDIDTIVISISGGSLSDDVTKNCQVKVYDVNDPSIQKFTSLTLELEKAKICIPNKVFADGNIIKKCNSDGNSIDILYKCKYGVVSDGKGGYSCGSAKLLENYEKNKIEKKYECNSDSECKEFSYCHQEIHACVQKSGCINVINNGDSSTKADIAFVGDGYSDFEELKKDVLNLVDYDGNNGYNGLMSVEPFKSNKNKFNIWMIKADNKIKYQDDRPVYNDAVSIATQCTSADYIMVISKKSYRSYCYFGTPCFNSVGSPLGKDKGRLILHEFGHGFAYLADEYSESGKPRRPTNPNCAPDIETAKKWWGDLEGIEGTEYYQGCSYVPENIRPTENSIMYRHWILKDDYYPVNERKILEVLRKYS